ncbi:MAG: carbohydrate ABC transporter permease [Treponemataceae bacterium]
MSASKRSQSTGFEIFNRIFLFMAAAACLLPFIYVAIASITTPEELLVKKVVLIPSQVSFAAYQYIFSTKIIPQSLGVSVFITVFGTLINISMTALMAYPLSRKNLRGRRPLLLMVVFTMLFNGGMIPTYLVVSSLHLLNSFWALWLPTAISAFNLILMRNFFQEIPNELIEAVKIDGGNDWQILINVILPLSLPAIAAFSLFYAVGHWNSFFNAILYIKDADKWPIQVWLRQIVLLSSGGFSDASAMSEVEYIPSVTTQYAVIIFATVPVLMIYPFVQKYFAKGVLVGSVKG